tara:strand:- start:1578 stop:2402 length:825 start_codon:yes stop_codon:yes gene_type:complete
MDRLINFLKNIIPLKLKIFLIYLKNINHNPYSLWAMFNPPDNLSDLFVLDNECEKVVFIAENIRAIMLGREVNVIHNFKFFSMEGVFLGKQTFEAKSFLSKITLKSFHTNDKYISFIHYVDSDISSKDILLEKKLYKQNKFKELNRGYSIFYPFNFSVGSAVHGNFGGITKDLVKTARRTLAKHIYTPIYKFDENSQYDIVFNNPTNTFININLIFNNSFKKIKLTIPSLGTQFVRIDKYCGSLSFESRLPICRALVFKNPTPNNKGNLDVFHS